MGNIVADVKEIFKNFQPEKKNLKFIENNYLKNLTAYKNFPDAF